jgi:hypothetical protein
MQKKKAYEHSHHGHAEFTRHSLRGGFTVSFVLSPVIGLDCHRRFACCTKLDASVEASRPHDFAVRLGCCSSAAPSASTASRVHVRDDRETPL